jgi:hypothetical protein
LFEAALLSEVQQRREEREEKSGVGGKEKGDVEEDPAAVDGGNGRAFLAWAEGWNQAEEEADGKDEDAEGDGFVASIDDEEGAGQEETEEGLGFASVDRKAMVGSIEHLGQGDEVEEDSGDGGGHGKVTPAGTIVEGGGQDRQGGYAVEEDRDSEPEERHRQDSPA